MTKREKTEIKEELKTFMKENWELSDSLAVRLTYARLAGRYPKMKIETAFDIITDIVHELSDGKKGD